jgi:hypothetical protein
MDADGTRSKGIARALRKVGIKASHSGIIHFEHNKLPLNIFE